MNIFSRFTALFQSHADTVSKQEPEDLVASLDNSLVELEQRRQDIRRSLVEINTARLRLEKQHDQLVASIARYDEQAQAALVAAQDDLAWEALQRKQAAVARRAEVETDLANLDRQLTSLKQSQIKLDRKIALFRSKKEVLTALHTTSQAQLRVQETLAGVSEELADVGNTIQRVESRIHEMQARAEAIDDLVAEGVLADALQPEGDEIDRRLARIGRRQAVEAELAQLKADLESSEPEERHLDSRHAAALARLKAEVKHGD
jgi:phage shock protein A